MEPIVWNDSFSVGVQELDRQHQTLAKLINDLAGCLDLSPQTSGLSHILSALADYAVYHFDYEEHLLSGHGFADLDDHRQEHDLFRNKIAAACQDSEAGRANAADLLAYLLTWWKHHVLRIDFEYKDFFREHGIR